MKKAIAIAVVLTAALAVPLTIIAVRDWPFRTLPPFGDELPFAAYAGSADRSEHVLRNAFNRVLKVRMLSDKNPALNRDLDPEEWSYDRRRHLLVTTVAGSPPSIESYPEEWVPYFIVEGILSPPISYYLDGFEGSAEDIFLYFYGERRAIEGRDFRYDSAAKTLTLGRDKTYSAIVGMYWNYERHHFVNEEIGKAVSGAEPLLPSMDPGPRLLDLEKQKFTLGFFERHPDLEHWFLRKSDGPKPEVFSRKMSDEERSALLEGLRNESRPVPEKATEKQIGAEVGFDAAAPDEVLGLRLEKGSRTIVESRRRTGTVRKIRQIYASGTERVFMTISSDSPARTPGDFQVSRETLALEGIGVEKTVRWGMAVEQNFAVAAFPLKLTEYSWQEGGTRWTIDTNELRNRPYREYEKFIAEFIKLRRERRP